jgi:hypothetical protein
MIGKQVDRGTRNISWASEATCRLSMGAPPGWWRIDLCAYDAIQTFGKTKVSEAMGINRRTLAKVERQEQAPTRVPHHVIAAALDGLWETRSAKHVDSERRLRQLKQTVERQGGIRAAGRALGVDASNLLKTLRALSALRLRTAEVASRPLMRAYRQPLSDL